MYMPTLRRVPASLAPAFAAVAAAGLLVLRPSFAAAVFVCVALVTFAFVGRAPRLLTAAICALLFSGLISSSGTMSSARWSAVVAAFAIAAVASMFRRNVTDTH